MSYRIDEQGNEIYEKDGNGNERVQHGRYARSSSGEAFYPKDRDGNGFVEGELIRRGEGYLLPRTALGKPRYPRDRNHEEYYPECRGRYSFGVGLDGHQYYAQRSNSDEFYPPDHTPARKRDGSFYYARNSRLETLFPVLAGTELYVGPIDWTKKHTLPDRYAREAGGDEYYPKTLTADHLESETLLQVGYAQKRTGEYFYPKDAFNNEFYRAGGAASVLSRYAVTNDLKVILPSVQNRPYIHASIPPAVGHGDILGRLIREKNRRSGFLTRVTLSNVPKPEPREYRFRTLRHYTLVTVTPKRNLTLKSFFTTGYLWVMLIIAFLVKLISIVWMKHSDSNE